MLSLMHEHIHTFGIPRTETDRHTGKTQPARQTDTDIKTDRQTDRQTAYTQECGQDIGRLRGSNPGSADRCRLPFPPPRFQPGNPMRAGQADGTMGSRSLGRGLLTYHEGRTRNRPPSGCKTGSITGSNCANVPRTGIKPGTFRSSVLRSPI